MESSSGEQQHLFWSAPTLEDLRATEFLKANLIKTERRKDERLELSVPATIITQRGAQIPAFTRDISRHGIGLVLHGILQPNQEATIKMASDTREYCYDVAVKWCSHIEGGRCIAGLQILPKRFENDAC